MIYLALIIPMLFLDFKQIKSIYIEEKPKLIAIWNYIKDWRTFVSFLIAWMITNGWCYVFIVLGSWLEIKWMSITGWSYLAFLWLPCTPEKVITIPLGIFIKKLIFRHKNKED